MDSQMNSHTHTKTSHTHSKSSETKLRRFVSTDQSWALISSRSCEPPTSSSSSPFSSNAAFCPLKWGICRRSPEGVRSDTVDLCRASRLDKVAWNSPRSQTNSGGQQQRWGPKSSRCALGWSAGWITCFVAGWLVPWLVAAAVGGPATELIPITRWNWEGRGRS